MVVWGMIKLSFRQERSSKNGNSYGRLHYHLLTSWLNLLFSVWFLWSPPEKCYQKSTFINSQTMLFFIRMMNDKKPKVFLYVGKRLFTYTIFHLHFLFVFCHPFHSDEKSYNKQHKAYGNFHAFLLFNGNRFSSHIWTQKLSLAAFFHSHISR